MKTEFKRLPERQHQAVLAAAQRPDHLIPGIDDGHVPQPAQFNKRTLVAVHKAGLGDMRPSEYLERSWPYVQSCTSLWLTPAGRAYATQFGVSCRRRRAVIIQCGEKKAEPSWEKFHYRDVIPAGQLYIGHYHRSLRRAASALTNPFLTWIMSAKFGLVPLKRPVYPYDLTLGQEGAITAERLARQAAALDLADAEVLFLGSQEYAEALTECVPHAVVPLTGALFAQRSQCKAVRETPTLARAWWDEAAARVEAAA